MTKKFFFFLIHRTTLSFAFLPSSLLSFSSYFHHHLYIYLYIWKKFIHLVQRLSSVQKVISFSHSLYSGCNRNLLQISCFLILFKGTFFIFLYIIIKYNNRTVPIWFYDCFKNFNSINSIKNHWWKKNVRNPSFHHQESVCPTK